jgi:hypothetical protein
MCFYFILAPIFAISISGALYNILKQVAMMISFLTTFTPDKRDPGMDLSSYAWFVVVDDDTYIKVLRIQAQREDGGIS